MHKRGYFRKHPLYPTWDPADDAPPPPVSSVGEAQDRIPTILQNIDFTAREILLDLGDDPGTHLTDLDISVKAHEAHWIPQMVPLSKEMTILDLGCGYGRSAEWLWRTVRKVYGVDISKEIIQVCKTRFRAIQNVEFYENAGNDLGMFPPNSFDLIYCFNVFQHIPREMTAAYLEEFRRTLKLGGFCLFNLVSGVNEDTKYGEPGTEWTIGYRQEEVRTMVEAAGLHLVRIHTWKVKRFEPYWLWVLATEAETI